MDQARLQLLGFIDDNGGVGLRGSDGRVGNLAAVLATDEEADYEADYEGDEDGGEHGVLLGTRRAARLLRGIRDIVPVTRRALRYEALTTWGDAVRCETDVNPPVVLNDKLVEGTVGGSDG